MFDIFTWNYIYCILLIVIVQFLVLKLQLILDTQLIILELSLTVCSSSPKAK